MGTPYPFLKTDDNIFILETIALFVAYDSVVVLQMKGSVTMQYAPPPPPQCPAY